MYLLKVVRPGGAEELTPECDRIFKTPLAAAGRWKLKLTFANGRDPMYFEVPSAKVETIFLMSRHGDTIDILGRRPRPGDAERHRRNRIEQQ